MRTSETLLLDFIRQSPQFHIPVNQRRFAWTQRECRQLWEDILDAGDRADVREHFLGPVMYLAAIDPLNAHWSPYLVYDGQQRLTTVSLILKALARHLRDDAAPDGFESAQIRNDYLLNAYRKGDLQYRLLLKPGDSETLLALIHDRPRPASPSSRILEAFSFFEKRVKQLGPDVSALCAGLRKLRIVAFDLKEGEDIWPTRSIFSTRSYNVRCSSSDSTSRGSSRPGPPASSCSAQATRKPETGMPSAAARSLIPALSAGVQRSVRRTTPVIVQGFGAGPPSGSALAETARQRPSAPGSVSRSSSASRSSHASTASPRADRRSSSPMSAMRSSSSLERSRSSRTARRRTTAGNGSGWVARCTMYRERSMPAAAASSRIRAHSLAVACTAC